MSLRLYRVRVDSNIYKESVFYMAMPAGKTVSDVQRKFSQGEVVNCVDLGDYDFDASKQDEYRRMYDIPSNAQIG